MVYCVYSLESPRCLQVKENRKYIPNIPPGLVLWLTLISSNYHCLEHIFMVPRVFELLKFYCICDAQTILPSNFIAGRPKAALLFWFFMVVLLSICLWYVSIVATCIAVHFAVCHALHNNKNKKIGKNRCLVFLNDLVLFCSVILSL